MATRIHVVMARDAPAAAIFRRGPTKQVRLLLWDRHTDQITGGQWLAGRVYEDRCALSPDGQLLVYFAMRRGRTWTAVSRPPYFTPLAVWEESGTWGGGGVFADNRRLLLRSNPRCLQLDPKFILPTDFQVEWSASADDGPQSGWDYREPDPEQPSTPSGRPRPTYGTYVPPIRSRVCPRDSTMVLEAHPVAAEDAYGPLDPREYLLRDQEREQDHLLGELDWADWDRNGDLLYARDGGLYRAPIPRGRIEQVETLAELADDHFAAMPPPPEAHQWPHAPRNRRRHAKR